MPVYSGPPLLKVTLNLYHDDVIKLRNIHGHGWTVMVRNWIHEKLPPPPSRTVETYLQEDFDD